MDAGGGCRRWMQGVDAGGGCRGWMQGGGCRGCTGGSPQAGCELGGPSAGKSPPRRPEAPQGRSRGPPRESRGAPKKNTAHTKSAAGFGPETPLARLSPAISLILSGVSQNEASFGKKRQRTPVRLGKHREVTFPGGGLGDVALGRGTRFFLKRHGD